MTSSLRILHLEDNPDNASLVQAKLQADGVPCNLFHVDNRADFTAALEKGGVDLILADYSTPKLDGLAALKIARERHPEIPFVFVTGAFHQESAVDLLQAGATDHALKPGLSRLAPAVLRAMREVEVQRRRKQAETRFNAIQDNYLLMTSTFDLADIFPTLLKKLDIVFPTASAYIAILDGTTGKLQPSACRRMDEAQWRASFETAEDSPESESVRSTLHVIRNVQNDEELLAGEFYRRQGFVSCLGMPLTARGEELGVLVVLTKDKHDFTEEEIELTKTLAAQAGLAVASARLYWGNKQIAHDLLSSENHVSKLVTGLMNAHDEEAKRIARVLHDESEQLLASVYISLDEIAKCAPDSAAEQFERAKKLLHQVEDRLRDLSHELYPTILDDLGLLPSLELLAGQIGKQTSLKITVNSEISGRFSRLLELTLYRVVQEALNNTARHARASQADVRIFENSECIHCSIRDNGVGFEVETFIKNGAAKDLELGLSGMRERVAAVEGTLQILSAPNSGTEILIRIPKKGN